MPGITTTGFQRKRLADIKTEIEDSLKATFGAGINLSAETVFGQMTGIFSEREDLVWQYLEEVYNSQYPDTAFGVSLDNVVALTGIQRIPARASLCDVTLSGVAGTVIPAGSLIAVTGSGPQFKLQASVTIGLGGTVTATAESVDKGAIAAPTGTLTRIITPVFGWASVTNPADAVMGNVVESDTALRKRRRDQLQKSGSATLDAIRAKLLTVSGVTHVIVFENTSSIVDGNGLPPHSFEAFVEGGVNQAIADAIWASKAAGIQSYGSIVSTVTDSQGIPHLINWSRPVEKNVYVIVNVTKAVSGFPADGATRIRDAILAYGQALGVGDPVIVSPAMIAAFAGVPGIIGASVLVGLAPSPSSSSNIIQAPFEIAKFDSTRVTVNVT